MAAFSLLVEVRFDGATWIDITQYVRVSDGVNITCGRADEEDEIQTGTATLSLNNDGRFTPGLATSPYYPNVRKNVAIRIGQVVGATTHWRFYGYVNEWPVTWEQGESVCISPITCSDVFKRLGAIAPMRSLLEEEMLALEPDLYYTLGEPDGSTSAGDTSGTGWSSMRIVKDNTEIADSLTGTITFAASEGPGVDDLPAVQFLSGNLITGDSTRGRHLEVALPAGSSGFVLACWFAKDGPEPAPPTTWGLMTLADDQMTPDRNPDGEGTQFNVRIQGEKGVQVANLDLSAQSDTDFDANGITDFTTEWPDIDFFDAANHFVAVAVSGTGVVTTYLDGQTASFTYNWASSVRVNSYRRLLVGGGSDTGDDSTMFDGTISHVWMKRGNTIPDWDDVWAAAGNTSTTVTGRFARLCSLLSLTGTVLGSSSTEIDPQAAGGKAPLQALQDVAAVENGLVYASRSGDQIVFECRNYRYNKAISITLTDEDVQGDLTWSDDDQPLMNDCTNAREGGADQRVIDQDSIDLYGIYAGGESQPWASDTDARAAAQWAIANSADPPPRVTQVTVVANALASHEDVLGLGISDIIRLTSLPAESPETTVDLHIEGYAETIRHNYHSITYNTSPAARSDVWQLQVAGRSELGVTTRLGL
jgi:hypothetical protein